MSRLLHSVFLEWWGAQFGSRSTTEASKTNARECGSVEQWIVGRGWWLVAGGSGVRMPKKGRRYQPPYPGWQSVDDRGSLQRRNFEHSNSDRGPRENQ
jgi:hypothetical protein